MLGPYREGQVRALNGVQKRAAKFENNINESCWEILAQCRLVARICARFKAYTGGRAWKVIGDTLLKLCYLSRDDHNRKIRTRKQRTDVGKYSFVNRTIESWNQLPAGLLDKKHWYKHVPNSVVTNQRGKVTILWNQPV